MISATTVAGRYPVRSRLDPSLRRPRVPAPPRRAPTVAIAVSALGHAGFLAIFVAMILWNGWHSSKVYVVNLVPTVAAVGTPQAPTPSPSLPARPEAPAPSRAPTPDPTPAPRERPIREAPRLPEPSLPRPSLPPRSSLVRSGEKELPPLSSSSGAVRPERAQRTERPVESRPAPPAPRGLPTGSPTGAGALAIDASDFPYAWYLRQVLQKVQTEWQRQNLRNDPTQRPLVMVEIQRDGSIRAPRIEQTSGNVVYDQAALRAIVEASPFPPLPQDWSRPSLRVMFRFDLDRS